MRSPGEPSRVRATRIASLCVTFAVLLGCKGVVADPPPDRLPDRDETLSITACSTYALHPVGTTASCSVARDAAQWAQHKRGLLAVGQALPDSPCAFGEHEAVLVVLPMCPSPLPQLRAFMATEEGVDVLTITQRAPSEPVASVGEGRALLSPAALVVLPKRSRQLAVVLRDERAGAVGETTIAMFDALR